LRVGQDNSMKGIWIKEFPLKILSGPPHKKYYYLVDKIKDEDAFRVIADSIPEGGVYAKGSRLTLIDKNTKFFPIGSGDLFKIIFKK